MRAKDFKRKSGGNGGGNTFFNSDRPIKATFPVGQNLADLGAENTVHSFLETGLFPFTPAAISIGGANTFEKGGTYSPAITGALSLNEQEALGVSNRRTIRTSDQTVLNNPGGNNFGFTAPAITASESYKHLADVDNNGNTGYDNPIESSIINVNLIYPLFYGVSADPNLSGTDLYNALTRSVTTEGTKVLAFTGSNVYLYVVYPESWSDLSTVIDNGGAGDNVTSAFTSAALVGVDSVGLTPGYSGLNYKFNRTNNLTSASGDSFQFSF